MGEFPSRRESDDAKNDFRLADEGDIGDRRLVEGAFGGGILTRAYFGSGGQSYIR